MTTASLTPSTRRVLRIYRAATPDEVTAGREWYRRARELAETLDPGDVTRAAAVIAVLSPQTSWPLNARQASAGYRLARDGATFDEIVAGFPTGTMANRRKAAALLCGADPAAVVSGPKVSAFFHVIANPDDARAVVVDRHAFDVAAGRVTDDATRVRYLSRKGGYATVADCYLRAARILTRETGERVTAAEVQAVTWERWRRTVALANHGSHERARLALVS